MSVRGDTGEYAEMLNGNYTFYFRFRKKAIYYYFLLRYNAALHSSTIEVLMNNENEEEKIAHSFNSWIATLIKTTETNLAQHMLLATAKGSPAIERANSFFLTVTGASAGLIISNLDRLQGIIDYCRIKYSLVLLVVGALFGLLSKVLGIRAGIELEGIEYTAQQLNFISKQFNDQIQNAVNAARTNGIKLMQDLQIDFPKVIKEVSRGLSFWMKRKISSLHHEQISADPLLRYHAVVRMYHKQSFFALLHFVCYIGFIIIIVTGI